MNETAKETWDDEFTLGGVTKAPSRVVRVLHVSQNLLSTTNARHGVSFKSQETLESDVLTSLLGVL
jgi:hypothetical protein